MVGRTLMNHLGASICSFYAVAFYGMRRLSRRQAACRLLMVAVYLVASLPLPMRLAAKECPCPGGEGCCASGGTCSTHLGEAAQPSYCGGTQQDCCCSSQRQKGGCCSTRPGKLRGGSCCSKTRVTERHEKTQRSRNASDNTRSSAFVSCPCGCGTARLLSTASQPRITPPAVSLSVVAGAVEGVVEQPLFLPDVHFSPETPPPCPPGSSPSLVGNGAAVCAVNANAQLRPGCRFPARLIHSPAACAGRVPVTDPTGV